MKHFEKSVNRYNGGDYAFLRKACRKYRKEGLSYNEIASKIGCSAYTVKRHCNPVYEAKIFRRLERLRQQGRKSKFYRAPTEQ